MAACPLKKCMHLPLQMGNFHSRARVRFPRTAEGGGFDRQPLTRISLFIVISTPLIWWFHSVTLLGQGLRRSVTCELVKAELQGKHSSFG